MPEDNIKNSFEIFLDIISDISMTNPNLGLLLKVLILSIIFTIIAIKYISAEDKKTKPSVLMEYINYIAEKPGSREAMAESYIVYKNSPKKEKDFYYRLYIYNEWNNRLNTCLRTLKMFLYILMPLTIVGIISLGIELDIKIMKVLDLSIFSFAIATTIVLVVGMIVRIIRNNKLKNASKELYFEQLKNKKLESKI